MSAHTKRFLFHALLLTTGVALILLRVFPLSALGLGVFLLSFSYSSYRRGAMPSVWWLVGLIVLCGLAAVLGLAIGTVFTKQTTPSWYLIVFPAFWLADLMGELRQWRKMKRGAHGF